MKLNVFEAATDALILTCRHFFFSCNANFSALAAVSGVLCAVLKERKLYAVFVLRCDMYLILFVTLQYFSAVTLSYNCTEHAAATFKSVIGCTFSKKHEGSLVSCVYLKLKQCRNGTEGKKRRHTVQTTQCRRHLLQAS